MEPLPTRGHTRPSTAGMLCASHIPQRRPAFYTALVLYCTVVGSCSERPNGRERRPGDGDTRDERGRSGPRRCSAEPLAAAGAGGAAGPLSLLPPVARNGAGALGRV